MVKMSNTAMLIKRLARTRGNVMEPWSGDTAKALCTHRMHVVGMVRWSAQLEKPLVSLLRLEALFEHVLYLLFDLGTFQEPYSGVGCLITVHVLELAHTKQILVHYYEEAGQFARAVRTMGHWKLRSIYPCITTHEFKLAEFHAASFVDKMPVPVTEKRQTVAATCLHNMSPSVCQPIKV